MNNAMPALSEKLATEENALLWQAATNTTLHGPKCACVGFADEKTGEAVKLFVVKSANATLTEDDLIAHCRQSLAAYKIPKIVRFVEALPKSTVGKILRRELRDVA